MTYHDSLLIPDDVFPHQRPSCQTTTISPIPPAMFSQRTLSRASRLPRRGLVTLPVRYKHTLPCLEWDYGALEPAISGKIMQVRFPLPSIGDSQYRGKPLTWGRLGGAASPLQTPPNICQQSQRGRGEVRGCPTDRGCAGPNRPSPSPQVPRGVRIPRHLAFSICPWLADWGF